MQRVCGTYTYCARAQGAALDGVVRLFARSAKKHLLTIDFSSITMKLFGALLLTLLPQVLGYGESCHYDDSDKYGVRNH